MAGGDLAKRADGRIQLLGHERVTGTATVRVPVLGCAPCGAPFFAEENLEGHVRVDARLARPPHAYFALHATGDSMNLAGIDDGALVLVRSTRDAHDGDRVVALVDGEATIKVLRLGPGMPKLEPRSSNASHEPIYATNELEIQGVVVASLT